MQLSVDMTMEERLRYYLSLRGTSSRYSMETFRERVYSSGTSGFPEAYLFHRRAAAEHIIQYADAIGDLNRRFRDPHYAKETIYGRLVAPSLFLQGVCLPASGWKSTPGARSLYAGTDWEFYSPVLEGDELEFEGMGHVDAELVPSKSTGQMLHTTSVCAYRHRGGSIVATATGHIHHSALMNPPVSPGTPAGRDAPYQYSVDELRRIETDREGEELRGNLPRYWEDVVEGETTPHIVVGPYTMMSGIAWMAALPTAWSVKGERLERLATPWPDLSCFDPRINAPVNPELMRLDQELARGLGAPGSYDVGGEREALVSTLFHNWTGDDGFLWKYSVRYRKFVVHGDTNWYTAAVTRTYIEDARCCVDLDLSGVNQRGETTTRGAATVILPSRVHGAVRYPAPPSLDAVLPRC